MVTGSVTHEKQERRTFLKGLKSIANKHLAENKAATHHMPKWETLVRQNNIAQLKSIIKQLNYQLTEDRLNNYLSDKRFFFSDPPNLINSSAIPMLLKFRDECLLYEIARYSSSYSITNDLYWITDGFVHDHLDIALGTKSPNILENFCEGKIRKISDVVIPYLSARPAYYKSATLLLNVVEQFQNNGFLATNILLQALIESLVRHLAVKVYHYQNANISLLDAKKYISSFQSLEQLILKGKWENDIPINFYDAVLRSKYIDDSQLIAADEILKKWEVAKRSLNDNLASSYKLLESTVFSDEEKRNELIRLAEQSMTIMEPFKDTDKSPVMVSLKVELQFLVRKFKDDRNTIVHGNFENFDKKWKSLVNLSAVFKVYELMVLLEKLYSVADHTLDNYERNASSNTI